MPPSFARQLQRLIPPRSCERLVRHLPNGGALRSNLIAGPHPFLQARLATADRVHLLWLMRGRGWWRRSAQALPMHGGVVCWRGADDRVDLDLTAEEDPVLWCLVAPAALAGPLWAELLGGCHRPLRVGYPEYLLKRVCDWHRVLAGASGSGVLRCWARVQELLVDLHERAEPDGASSRHPWLQELADSLARHPGRRVALGAVAAQHGISATHLRRLFLEQFGETPQRWCIRRRVERAQGLLLETGMRLTAVAERLGYADLAGFAKQFKRETGISPAAFRRSG